MSRTFDPRSRYRRPAKPELITAPHITRCSCGAPATGVDTRRGVSSCDAHNEGIR